ncbi:MAG TPA: hypothetical protein VD793_11385 [Gemmatimonadales bacterium]|nr:hypothetical protein [Gemmatimonadales bacterium]
MPTRTADLSHQAPLAMELAALPAMDLLRALDHGPAEEGSPQAEMRARLEQARGEVNALRRKGRLGLTVSLADVTVRDVPEGLLRGRAGELYLVSWILSGNGRAAEFRSHRFPGIRAGERLPLGEGGMLLGFLEEPRWFVDLHALVMEADADLRTVAGTLDHAKKETGWSDMLQTLAALEKVDPGRLMDAANLIGRFADLVVTNLKQNGSDHMATIHDFYLEHQGFGAGRHPAEGTTPFQGVDAAYTIGVSVTR